MKKDKVFPQPEIAASVMMRRTSFSNWELLQISSHVPRTCSCSASTISCLWLGTTKLITYDWSLENRYNESTNVARSTIREKEIQLQTEKRRAGRKNALKCFCLLLHLEKKFNSSQSETSGRNSFRRSA